MGENSKDKFQEDLLCYIELGDYIHGIPMEEAEQKVNAMETIYKRYFGDWGLLKKFPAEKMADAMCELGQEYYRRERYWDSLFWCKQAGIYYGMAFGQESLSAAECNIWLAMACHELGNYTESLKWCMDALLMRENLLNNEFQDNLQIYFIMAKNYMMKGYYMAAQEMFGKIYDNTEDKGCQAEVFRNMGIVCDKQGDNRNALNWFVKAVEIKEELYGRDSLEAATLYNSIGIIYCNIKKYGEAEDYLMRALAVKEEQLPSNSISLSNTFHQLGVLESYRNQYAKALEWLQKSLEIRTSVLDKGHPLIADSFLSIGGVYIRAGAYTEALDYHKKALEIYIQSLGRDHRHTEAIMDNIRMLETQIEVEKGESHEDEYGVDIL